MARIPESFNFGDRSKMSIEQLLLVLERMYVDLATAINSKPDLYQRTVDGQPGDTFLANGSININSSTNKVEMLTNHVSTSTVTWTQLS
jgi:hypothetical protein